MDPFTISAIIGAGSSIVGGLFGQQNNQANIQAQQAINAQNLQQQLNFAQNSVQWRAQDATKAQDATGINRLALLGVPTNSFSNLVGPPPRDNSLGEGLRGAGQDISRAVTAAATLDVRQRDLEQRLLQAKIDNVNADTVKTQELTSQAARANAPGTPPAPPAIEPMYIKVRGDRGELIEIPNPKIATSLQTPASWPQQAAMAAKAPFEMAADAYRYYSGIARDQYNRGFNIPLRRDAWRGVDNSQYVPF